MNPRKAAAIRAGIMWALHDLYMQPSDHEPRHGITRAAYLHTLRNHPHERRDLDDIREYRRQTWKRA